eukprot:g19487.t1
MASPPPQHRKIEALLISNRSECALRIHRTCRKLGIRSVGIYTEPDAQSLHRANLDACYLVPSYTDVDAILCVAKEACCDAVHPGYGFLSENPAFARKIQAAGLLWVGPDVKSMECFGLKDKAREAAAKCNVPISEGSPLLASASDAKTWAERVGGYPVILKPTGGGGGIGMTIIRSAGEMGTAFDAAQTLSQKFFGEKSLILEKYVENGRHIEVQVFGDGRGGVVHLGERECSVQRRNQKVVEETPSAALTDELRAELCNSAVKLCSSVCYESAGTVEFILDDATKNYFFLEVNTRLQVEHGVTEMVNGNLDLVEWMILQAQKGHEVNGNWLRFDVCDSFAWQPSGHAIQVRVYAEDCLHDYKPSSGVLQEFSCGNSSSGGLANKTEEVLNVHSAVLRHETSFQRGATVPSAYDPLLVKVLQYGATRFDCIAKLRTALANCEIAGVVHNLGVLQQFLGSEAFVTAQTFCGKTFGEFLEKEYQPAYFEVLSPGVDVTVQDFPGRTGRGLWRIGVPPSGAFDHLSSRLANSLVGNSEEAATLEFLTVQGPTLKLWREKALVAVCGPDCCVKVEKASGDRSGKDGGVQYYPQFAAFEMRKGDVLSYLGSRSTFVKGEFGGFRGRGLKKGDLVPLAEFGSVENIDNTPPTATTTDGKIITRFVPKALWPSYSSSWKIGVLPGPRADPDFMLREDIEMLHSTTWEVHYNSNRLGIRLNGPKPVWARPNGGEGGSHPSNIHDEEYAVGTINFTGDMPIIIAHDGPSLGGFVCPITICQAELWKIGQVKAGDSVQFELWDMKKAMVNRMRQDYFVKHLMPYGGDLFGTSGSLLAETKALQVDTTKLFGVGYDSESFALPNSPVLYSSHDGGNGMTQNSHPGIALRMQGDRHILVEYGPMVLDLTLRVRVHFLEQNLLSADVFGLEETAPGVRSLQIRYSPLKLPLAKLLKLVLHCDSKIGDDLSRKSVKTRVFHLPMCYDSPGCQDAMDKYSKSIRDDAPYLPSNIAYVAKNNGLYKTDEKTNARVPDTDEVHKRIFRASYMCLGLGDVYLGACCAVPVNPLDRLITTKMNPARTWTEEGTVGLGGAYMCIYPMYSPGGYQLVGRTLPIWNTYASGQKKKVADEGHAKTKQQLFSETKPWLLEMFDQVRFYEVSDAELTKLREDFRSGVYSPVVEAEDFKLAEHKTFLEKNADEIARYQRQQQIAMAEQNEQEWLSQERLTARASSAAQMRNSTASGTSKVDFYGDEADVEVGKWKIAAERGTTVKLVDAYVSGSVWDVPVQVGDVVQAGQTLVVLEAMKMEIPVVAEVAGKVAALFAVVGGMKEQGDPLIVIEKLPDAVELDSETTSDDSKPKTGGPRTAGARSPKMKEVSSTSTVSTACTAGEQADSDRFGFAPLPRTRSKNSFSAVEKQSVADALASLSIADLSMVYGKKLLSPLDVLHHVFDCMEKHDELQPENNIWISRGSRARVLADCEAMMRGVEDFDDLPPLYGIPFVVKDNYDVAGWDTTCACEAYRRLPEKTAACVQQLLDAGGILLGKANLDQFATGLVGTRSPFGVCKNPFDPQYISGGSSSGSAAAVSLRFATFSLGTDTAGSGRVPAGYCNLVGLKPSKGRISNEGMVPACKTLDCVSVFGLNCEDCCTVLGVLEDHATTAAAGAPAVLPDFDLPVSMLFAKPAAAHHPAASSEKGRTSAASAVLTPKPEDADSPSASPSFGVIQRTSSKHTTQQTGSCVRNTELPGALFTFGVPDEESLKFFGKSVDVKCQMRELFARACDQLEIFGGSKKSINYAKFVECADLLYQGPWVCERKVAVEQAGCYAAEKLLQTTKTILDTAEKHSACDAFRALYRLEELKGECKLNEKMGVDFLVVPTVATSWTIAEVEANPIETNTQNGYYTNFMNLLDMCGVAVPVGFVRVGGGGGEGEQGTSTKLPFGVTFCGEKHSDGKLLALGAHFMEANKGR